MQKFARIAEISANVIQGLLIMFTLYAVICIHGFLSIVDNTFTFNGFNNSFVLLGLNNFH